MIRVCRPVFFLVGLLLVCEFSGAQVDRPTASLERLLVDAETAVEQGEPRLAESYYRTALEETRRLLGSSDLGGELENRLRATETRLQAHIAILQAQTGFGKTAADLDPPPREGRPFGRLVLDRERPVQGVRPLSAEPVRWLHVFPSELHGVIEAVDAGDLDLAEEKLRKKHEDARTLLGLVLLLQGKEEAGERELLEGIEADDSTLSARQALARLYHSRDRPEAFQEQLLQAAELGELDRDLALALADLELEDGRIPAANRQLRSLDRRFESVEARLRLARVFRQLGNPKLSMDHLQKALAKAPKSEEVLLAHALQALQADLVSEASRSVETLARTAPENAAYQVLLGRVWIGLGKMGEASEALLRAVELDPNHVPAFLPLGLALHHESRFEEARDYLARYLAAHPHSLEAAAALAESEERLGDAESAERRAEAVLAEDSSVARAHLVLGMVRTAREELGPAREAFEKAVAEDPTLKKAHYQLSLVCVRLGDRECARTHLAEYRKVQQGPEAAYTTMESVRVPEAVMLQKNSDEKDPGGGP